MELDREELSTNFDEANQTIGALMFENNFLVKKTKKLKAELFQVRVQLEKTLSAKLDEMLSPQKSTSDRTGLGYGFSFSNIASTNSTIFVPSSNNVEIENNDVKTDLTSENIDKCKFILGAPLKQDKKEAKNLRAKKANSQRPKQKKQHLCHHCGVVSHNRPKQRHDSIWKAESASIVSCFPWRSSQSFHVPFELE